MPDIIPVNLESSFQKAEVKRVSLSENSFRGIPCSRHTWSTKSLAMRWESLPLKRRGMKWTIFDFRSVTVMMASCPLAVSASPVIKSTLTSCHLLTGGSAWWSCAAGLCRLIFVLWQTGHTLQRSSTSLAMLVHQNRCLSTASVLCTPTCPARGAEWHSRNALSLNDGGLAGSTSWYRPSAMRQSRLPTLLKSLRVPSSVSFCHCWHSTSSC